MVEDSASTRKVVVAGDVALDWLEQTIPRTEWKDAQARRNYELYNPGFCWTAVWGGAVLLRRLVAAALRAQGNVIRVEGPKVPTRTHPLFNDIIVPKLTHEDTHKYLQSLALVGRVEREAGEKSGATPIRVQQF